MKISRVFFEKKKSAKFWRYDIIVEAAASNAAQKEVLKQIFDVQIVVLMCNLYYTVLVHQISEFHFLELKTKIPIK
jgi:hypothetical protein